MVCSGLMVTMLVACGFVYLCQRPQLIEIEEHCAAGSVFYR